MNGHANGILPTLVHSYISDFEAFAAALYDIDKRPEVVVTSMHLDATFNDFTPNERYLVSMARPRSILLRGCKYRSVYLEPECEREDPV